MTRSFKIAAPIHVSVEEEQPIYLMSDMHIGSRDLDILKLREDLDKIRSDGGVLFINGDVLDMILPTDKRYELSGQVTDYSNHMVNHHISLAVELLAPIAKQIRMIGIGNHEHTAIVKYHVDPIKILLNDLYRETGACIAYGGYEGFIKLQVPSYQKSKHRSRFYIRYHHGWGGTPKSGTRIAHNDLRLGSLADVYWIGHKHITEVGRARIYIPHQSYIEVREILTVSTGSYLHPYSDHRESYTPYSTRCGMIPQSNKGYVSLKIKEGRIFACDV